MPGRACASSTTSLSWAPAARFGGGASATGQSGEISTTVAGESPTRRASYDIDGYVLTLRHADGRVEQRLLVTDPKDLDVVWIDGDGYTR